MQANPIACTLKSIYLIDIIFSLLFGSLYLNNRARHKSTECTHKKNYLFFGEICYFCECFLDWKPPDFLCRCCNRGRVQMLSVILYPYFIYCLLFQRLSIPLFACLTHSYYLSVFLSSLFALPFPAGYWVILATSS